MNGKNTSGQQHYRCNDCKVTRVIDSVQKSKQLDLETVAQTYKERNSFRSTGRIFKVSHVTVQKWLKKAQPLANFKTTILPAKEESVLEVDEVFSFVLLKINNVRIWTVRRCDSPMSSNSTNCFIFYR